MTFELYKSAVCQRVKSSGEDVFIREVSTSDEIPALLEKREFAEALYLLAMLDYLSRKRCVSLCARFDSIRDLKLVNIVYPQDIELLALLQHSDEVKRRAWEEAIPEFKRHNIVENEVENVC